MGALQRAVAVPWVGLLACAIGSARAQFEVMEPAVERGVSELEAIGSVEWGFDAGKGEDDAPKRQGHEFSLGYGLTEFWQPQLAFELEQEKGEDLEASALALENTFVLPLEDVPVGTGFFLAYERSLTGDDIHALEFGPIVQFALGPLVNTANPFFEKQFGDDREEGVAFEYAWQTLFEAAADFGIGFEAYGTVEDFAGDAPAATDQEHRLGPVAIYALGLGESELGIELGFLFGLTRATADAAFKWNLELEF